MMETAKKSLPDFSAKLDGDSHASMNLLTYLLAIGLLRMTFRLRYISIARSDLDCGQGLSRSQVLERRHLRKCLEINT